MIKGGGAILSSSLLSSLGLILCGFRRKKSKQQGKKKFLNTRNVIWNHKLLHVLTKIRGNYLPQKKNKKNNTLIHKIHYLSGKNTFSPYRQRKTCRKQPEKMADIETIDTRNREVNCLYLNMTPCKR
jgi:hypothetical protein